MSVTRRLVSLYPRAFRQRWGDAVEAEARTVGIRSWPQLVHGIVDMWLHPAMWPADTMAQRRARASVLATAVAAVGWFYAHLVAETDSALSPAATRSWAMTASLMVMVIGLILVTPMPRLTRGAITATARGAIRRLLIPTVIAVGVVVWAQAGVPVASAWLRLTLMTCWYGSLAAGAVQTCRLVADLGGRFAEPPPPGRLRLGMPVLAVGIGLTGAIILGAAVVAPGRDVVSAVVGAGVLGLALAPIATLRDLHRLTPGWRAPQP